MLKSPPESRREATIKIGIAHEVSISDPNTTFPVIAPKRATAKLTAIAVDIQREGKKNHFRCFIHAFLQQCIFVLNHNAVIQGRSTVKPGISKLFGKRKKVYYCQVCLLSIM